MLLVYISTPMKTFEDLDAWKFSMNLAEEVYRITANFPQSEQFGLTSQMRRASTSIPANIAEGFGRYTYRDKAYKYIIARGECTELRSHFHVAVRVGFIDDIECKNAFDFIQTTGRLLNGLIRSCNCYAQKTT